ncbi:MAG: hypothetical protein EAZ74_02025 [Alphaproteobacteria bacterium]|nr:MAG: hypothetical protein EAZ74_02025 [Alphaproteobacteria bacterium]TAF74981.1 MAG: hypothetical protein EAZ52_07565 [Alphaproteobacteria bacterium]
MNSFNERINAAKKGIYKLINAANDGALNDNQKYGWSKRSGDSWGIALSKVKQYEDVLELIGMCVNVDDVWKKMLHDCFFIDATCFNQDGTIKWSRVFQNAQANEYPPDILVTPRADAWHIVYSQFWL